MLEIAHKYSPRRRSIGLTVTVDGKVVVAAVSGVSQSRIAQALAQHRDWIARKVAARKEAWSRLQDGTAFYLGKPYRLAVALGPKATVALDREEIRVRLPKTGDFWQLLQAWYRQEADRLIEARVHHFARLMRLKVGSAQVRDWKQRWGECHPEKGLSFNWRLILLPPEALDYVVVHELAHLQVPGHPPAFWRRVAKIMPDFATHRRWLNHSGAPFLVWRPVWERAKIRTS
jgi:predicted metal-dependent hydrolase